MYCACIYKLNTGTYAFALKCIYCSYVCMCMYGSYMHVYTCICLYVHMLYLYAYTYISVHMCIYIPVLYVYVCICVCNYMHLYMYVCVCIRMYLYVYVCMCIYVHLCSLYTIYMLISGHMSSRRGSAAHTGTYDGADGCSNPNFNKGILFQKRLCFARKIYPLKDFRKDQIFCWNLNHHQKMHTCTYVQIRAYTCTYIVYTYIYIRIHTIYTIYRHIHTHTSIYIHIHTYTYTARRIMQKMHQAICACIHLYVHV